MVKQSDHYDLLSAYLKNRDLQKVWQRSNFLAIAAQSALPTLMLWSPTGPTQPLLRAISVAISVLGVVGATLWLFHWPTRRQSILFAFSAMTAIAVASLCLSNPYTGLMGCTVFAMLGGFIAYFHSLRLVLTNFVLAVICAAILAHRFITADGDVALISAGLITVAVLNVGVPFGILSLMHTLRNDLRSADRDSLTGLHNRRSFYNAVSELMALQGRPPGTYLVTVVIDLDNFKQINDTQGHAVGDQALVAVGSALEQNCRPAAVIARVGGEEFVVVDTAATPQHATMTEQLRQAVADLPFSITASIGTAAIPLAELPAIADMQVIDDLIGSADAAMYEAKRAGGNQVRHCPDLMRAAQ
ncbi:MAG: GGDEF domain-containing protein [Actinomycetota bacterium]|uniref:GGDEF domain-containing protein n=1 Tax=Mycobacterium lentiflavum TaxID=141349 RepID=A0ABY3UQ23_MYCLN|nr:GGDEF domain-containing protein [Mycobacterium lentiflavum]MEE3063354.1 GGDEF domain-containing protein [Actinomycetota bacterium]ULP41678.1 GGDEF domain-containing protein [Mycobacterium lentiflavum]